MICRG